MEKVELIDRAAVRALAYVSSDWSHGAHPLVVELSDIDDLPNIDAAPVRRGSWKKEPYLFGWTHRCNRCGENYGMPHGMFNFCPNCGADMRKEEHNDHED